MPLAGSYEQARIQVEQLVERFDRNLDLYKRPGYKEARVRVEFIDPFFEALGWDVRNVQGCGEHDKDVIHEDVLSIGGKPRAPDYSFRIGQKRQFFVEAKKPAVSLKTDVAPALQLRRYSWTAKLPLGLLTDFEELAVYDCRFRPAEADKPSVGCIEYITFDSYLHRFDDIYGLFAKPSVQQGSLDQYAQERTTRGTSEVDAELLKEINGWREQLAWNIALRNPALSTPELNDAVQRTIDRIIFLRMAEDRGIEEYKRLLRLTDAPQIYARMAQTVYRQADEKYNSGLFDFQADTLTPTLQIDDRVLKPILTSLYYPQSPYEFSVLPVEILGQVYEQFLGKVIKLTRAHRARVEEKPEVRKAGGVYYTPSYIVDYIVRQTVGKLVEGKSPRQLRGSGGKAPLRILDPACGSGSFLLGAYQCLLDHYLHWYQQNDPERQARSKEPPVYQGAGAAWFLTTAERKRILLDHIYGVDIDRQAVEVTKLSLLLKVLEGETQETLGQQLSLWRERALPDLKDNIKCGNSLIGPDYFEGKLLVDEEEYRRVNPFDWQREFPEVMATGGFDAVIGNPPYVLLQDEFRDDAQGAYFRRAFQAASYKLDTYHLFIEQSLRLTRRQGFSSLITPANFLTNNYLLALREVILDNATIHSLNMIRGGVFRGVSVDNVVFVLERGSAPGRHETAFIVSLPTSAGLEVSAQQQVPQAQFGDHKYLLFLPRSSGSIWQKVREVSAQLGQICDVNFGMQLRDRKQFTRDVIEIESEDDLPLSYAMCYTGKNVSRYLVEWTGLACLEDQRARRGGCWDLDKHHTIGKILTKQIGKWPDFALDHRGYNILNTVFMVINQTQVYSTAYLLGLLNSAVMRVYWLENFYDQRITFPKIKGTYLKELPIRTIDFDDPADVARHDRLVALVERMLDLHKKLAAATIAADKELYQRQIEATDRQIDALVYELYGLTEDEIRIVEGQTG